MNKPQANEQLNKSIDTLIDELFAEPVAKASENFEVANASKTTADAAISSAPKMQDDASRGAGRPKQISDVPENDEDGKRDGQYDASIASGQSEVEPDEAKKQAKAPTQISSEGRLGEGPKMKDPRLSKSISDEEYAEFEAFKKAKSEAKVKEAQDELKKAEDLKKAELENLVKSAVAQAIGPLKQENETLKKSIGESQALIKAITSQPVRPKSVTGIDAMEKSQREDIGPKSFTKSEMLDAAERLAKSGSIPVDAVIELENTGTIYNRQHQQAVETELQKQN